jgi:hypothetical protein
VLHIALQLWGGIFYLLNKIFFSRAERSEEEKQERVWRIRSWSVYLTGLPAWFIIFVLEKNWIVAAVETAGAVAMALGLYIAIHGLKKEPRWANHLALVVVVVGITISIYDLGTILTVNQTLELSTTAGFLVGTYLLARQRPTGYLWFLLMNASMGTLMYIQNYPWLALQQIISFGFVADAYFVNKRKAEKAERASTPSPVT